MEITAEIITSFRTQPPYTAFADDTVWSDSVVEAALCEGDMETGGKGWGGYTDECNNFKRRGMFLYAAHFLASTYPKGDTSISGGAKSGTSGKSVGDESITYNVATVDNQGDQWLASTGFGQQWLRLRKRAGMGARAV